MSQPINFSDLLQIRCGGEQMMMGSGPTEVIEIESREQWEQKAEALRQLYRLILGHRPDGYDQPLDLQTESEEDCGEFLNRTVSYVVGPDERIRAYVLIPKDASEPLPAVLTIHPTNEIGREQTIGNDPSPKGQSHAYGLHLVRRGYVTLSYDIDSTNERMYPGQRYFGNAPFYDKCPQWSARGKDLYDYSCAVDVLEQIPEVDPNRIGSIGHSQGGGITIDVMAMEPRVKAGVSNCGDWPFRLSKNPFNRCRTGWWIGNVHLRPFALTGKQFPIDLHEKIALSAPRPFLKITALNDFKYTPEEEHVTRAAFEEMERSVRQVYELYGAGEKVEFFNHMKAHSFPEEERSLAYDFLDRHLKS